MTGTAGPRDGARLPPPGEGAGAGRPAARFHLADRESGERLGEVEPREAAAIVAVRRGEAGPESEPYASLIRKVIGGGLRIECGCRPDSRRAPRLGTRRMQEGRIFLVNPPGSDIAHAEDCEYRLAERAAPARPPPTVHGDVLNPFSRADADPGDAKTPPRAHRRNPGLPQGQPPRTMRGILHKMMQTARLNTLAVADGYGSPGEWLAAVAKAAALLYLPPRVPASEFLFTDPESWRSGEVARRLDAAAPGWPGFGKPFALLCWPAYDVGGSEVNREHREAGYVRVRAPVVRPVIGEVAVRGPYLFLGAVARSGDGGRWACAAACAQPIVAANCPVPVDSGYERSALGSLRSLVRTLEKSGPLREALGGAVRVALEKPLTRIQVAGGHCLPDFLITVTRPGAYSHLPEGPGHPRHRGRFDPGDRARYVVEVMGFDDPDYERDKEETHARMMRIGPLFRMEGRQFRSAGNDLRRQRERIAADIERDLLRRWKGA